MGGLSVLVARPLLHALAASGGKVNSPPIRLQERDHRQRTLAEC